MCEKIHLIEGADINLEYQVDLLLVYSGEKPVCSESICTGEIHYAKYIAKIKLLEDLMDTLGLFYSFYGHLKYSDPKKDGVGVSLYWGANLVFGKAESAVERFLGAGDFEQTGLVLGYPKTATEAFVNKRKSKDRPYDGSPLDYFYYFGFSEEFFEDEMKVCQRWHDTVKRLSPKIYKEIEVIISQSQ